MKTIAELLAMPKRITSTRAADKKAGHVQISATARGEGDDRFVVFVRVLEALHESFSIGVVHIASKTILVRVNGDHGIHKNPDGEVIAGPHVHVHEDETSSPSGADPGHAVPWRSLRPTVAGGWEELLARANLVSTATMDEKVRGLLADAVPPPEQLKLAFDEDGSTDQDPT